MDADTLRSQLEESFDFGIEYHGFTTYMRDYEVIFYMTADPKTGIPPAHVRYLFRYCVAADFETAVKPAIWARSLDDRLLHADSAQELDGYIWGANWQLNYPGARIIEDSPRAREWSEALALDFHEVRFDTNGHNMNLIFSDPEVGEVETGFTPYQVESYGPDYRIPFS